MRAMFFLLVLGALILALQELLYRRELKRLSPDFNKTTQFM